MHRSSRTNRGSRTKCIDHRGLIENRELKRAFLCTPQLVRVHRCTWSSTLTKSAFIGASVLPVFCFIRIPTHSNLLQSCLIQLHGPQTAPLPVMELQCLNQLESIQLGDFRPRCTCC